jgi:nitrogenase-stabilizing/protective protein
MDSLTQRLKALSSAEDFMAFFGIPFEERVVQVNRLHILKRFYQYLHKSTDLAIGDDIELFRQYRVLLQRAYGDFVHSNAATEKVFKVFQDVDGRQTVTAASLRDSLAGRRRGGDAGGQMAAAAPTLHQAG